MSWSDIFRKYTSRGHDYSDAAHRADQWEARALAAATGTAKTPQVAECEASQSGGRQPVTPRTSHDGEQETAQ